MNTSEGSHADGTVRSPMKSFLIRYVVLAVLLLIPLWAVIAVWTPDRGVPFPSPLVSFVSWGIMSSTDWSPMWVAAVIGCHLGVFLLVNAYLLLRVARCEVLSPLRSGLPSLLLVAVVTALSVRYWARPIAHHPTDGPLGGIAEGLRYQGPAYVCTVGILNLAAVVIFLVVLYFMSRHRARPGSWLVYNWALQVCLFVLFFPWLGGLP